MIREMRPTRVKRLIPGGQAIGTDECGEKAFFWNALPGEWMISYQITKRKSSYYEAIATEVAGLSPHRIDPADPCYLSTSPWQILDYDYELRQKQALVVELFRQHHIEIDTPEIFTDGQPYHYRNKMEYALYWDHDTARISLAFHARGSHRKIPITQSSIERPEIFAAAQQIVDDLNARHDEARRYQSLLLRCNQAGEVSGGLYENHQPHPHFNHLTDTILGHTYSYSPNGFFQINLPVYEMALRAIADHIVTDEVLDLYAGVGTIGLSVARDKKLTLVECDKAAYAELVENCKVAASNHQIGGRANEPFSSDHRLGRTALSVSEEKRFGTLTPILSKSEAALSYIQPSQTVILDPPRAGCDHKLIDRLLEVTPEHIIYLSCNPATQARDIAALLTHYTITTIQTFNFFPRTPHIENLVVLSRRAS